MKTLFFFLLSFLAIQVVAQDSKEKIMEKRAREMYRVMGLISSDDYKKFMKENYTKAYLEKPIKLKQASSGPDGTTSSESNDPLASLEAKAKMFARLHNDFGGSKIVSLRQTENQIEMVLAAASGLTGTFTFTFEKNKPYLIDGLGVQAEMN